MTAWGAPQDPTASGRLTGILKLFIHFKLSFVQLSLELIQNKSCFYTRFFQLPDVILAFI